MLNIKPTPLSFPQDTPRFLYWVFFKPITFRNYLYKIDDSLRSSDNPSLFTLWRKRKEHPEFISVIQLSLLNIFVMPLLAFPLAWLFQLAGFDMNFFSVAASVLIVASAGRFDT